MLTPGWARTYFDRGYGQRWGLHPPNDQIRSESAGIWKLLKLAPGMRVADIGCGHGRHPLAIADLGARAIGVDASVALLSRARELSAKTGVSVDWVRADMRSLPFRGDRENAEARRPVSHEDR